MILVAAVTVMLPSLWFTGLSMLAAAVPIIRERRSNGPAAIIPV